MHLDPVLFTLTIALAALWWADAAPLYIVAGKRGVRGPAYAFVPVLQLDVLARAAGDDEPLRFLAGRYSHRAFWATICEESGIETKWARFCAVPGLHFVAQWRIAAAVPAAELAKARI